MAEEMTQAEYAKYKEVSRAYVTNLIKKGKLPSNVWRWDGKKRLINVEAADRALLENLDPAYQKKTTTAKEAKLDKITYQEARTLNERYSASLKKLKYEAEQGKWIWRKDAEKMVFSGATQFKESAMSMIERVAPLMTAESDLFKAKQILQVEIRRMLQDLSDNFAKVAAKGK